MTVETWERAYAGFMQTGDPAAAGAAVRVAMHLLFDTALMAPVRGWLARAERLLDNQGETPANAWYAVVRNYERMLSGDLQGARAWARHAIEVGSKCDAAAAAIGRVAEARVLILDGDVGQGLALLDEAGVATVSGDLDPLSTGVVYCELVCALQGLAQYDLAEEWTEAMERWSQTSAIGSLHERCRVHRAEILRLRGLCNEAEVEALLACEELRPYLRRELGWPLSELGRIRLRKGDIEGAEEALLAGPSRRMGSPTGSRAGASGPRRRGDGGRIHTRRAGAPLAGALEGTASEHRPAAGAATRSPGRDRDRRRRHRPGPNGGRGAQGCRRSVPEQGAGRQRGPRPRKGATRRRRFGGRGAVPLGSCAALERSGRALRGGARTHGPRRSPPRQWQRASGRLGAPGRPHEPGPDSCRATGGPSGAGRRARPSVLESA